MKIAPFFYTKKSLIKKINQRNEKRIQEYTSVSPKISEEMSKKINQNINAIARFAACKNCNLVFEPTADTFEKSTQMSVYKRGLKMLLDNQSQPIFAKSTRELSGKVVLEDNIPAKTSFMDNIRTHVKNIINNDKNWSNRFSEIQVPLL